MDVARPQEAALQVTEELLKAEKAPAGRPGNRSTPRTDSPERPPTLRDLGITKNESADWQDRARVMDAVVKRAIGAAAAVVALLKCRPSTAVELTRDAREIKREARRSIALALVARGVSLRKVGSASARSIPRFKDGCTISRRTTNRGYVIERT